jgi:type I restriction enzyme M protein
MLAREIRSQIDSIWWSGGVSNPLSVIEQITYLLFIKRDLSGSNGHVL